MGIRVKLLLGLVAISQAWAANTKLKERFAWKQIDYAFPSEKVRKAAIDSKEFIPENNLPLGLDGWKDKLFVTVPRWKSGVLASLTYVKLSSTDKSPKLIPYPNWEAHNFKSRKGSNSSSAGKIGNVFRVNVDACDRLWMVDMGVSDILGKNEKLHPVKMLVFDLKTDKLLREWTVPAAFVKETAFLANIIVDDTKDTCDKAFAYIPDLGTNALIVYSWADNESWRVTHHYFHFSPLDGNYNIGGVNFQWYDGIFGVALSAPAADGYRTLYFHPMSSTREFAVSTKTLQNKTIADNYYEYKVLGSRGPLSQSSASSLDEKTGVLFYTLLNKDGVGCWNSNNKEYNMDTNEVLASDSETISFPNDLKVDKSGTLWVLSDRLPNFIYSELNATDVNYRIFSANAREAIVGTVCDVLKN